jgi:hypothetical protein
MANSPTKSVREANKSAKQKKPRQTSHEAVWVALDLYQSPRELPRRDLGEKPLDIIAY